MRGQTAMGRADGVRLVLQVLKGLEGHCKDFGLYSKGDRCYGVSYAWR